MRKIFLVFGFLVLAGFFVSASGELRSQSGGILIQPAAGEVVVDADAFSLSNSQLKYGVVQTGGYHGGGWPYNIILDRNDGFFAATKRYTVTASTAPSAGSLDNMFNPYYNSFAEWNVGSTSFPLEINIDFKGTVNHIGGFMLGFGWRDSYADSWYVQLYEDNNNDGVYQWTTVWDVSGNKENVVGKSFASYWRVKKAKLVVRSAQNIMGVLDISRFMGVQYYSGYDMGHSLPVEGGTMYGSITPYAGNTVDLGSDALPWRKVYAYTFVDKTPAFDKAKAGKTALDAVRQQKFRREGDVLSIDHDSLPEFVQADMLSTTSDGATQVVKGRCVNCEVTLQTQAIQELEEKVLALEDKVRSLEGKKGGIRWPFG